VQRLADAAKANRHGQRDATMILVAYRHGLRASELTDLRWDQIEFTSATLHVRRVTQGTPSTHPILGDELRALRRLQREHDPKSPFVFTSERGNAIHDSGVRTHGGACWYRGWVGLQGPSAHATTCLGYALANKGHDTRARQADLGHRNIQHTVRSTELSPTRFKDFWR
jgi:type 1 fimbriae regulatory protein FimB/type 1 fimbriae regulatory protein FimE